MYSKRKRRRARRTALALTLGVLVLAGVCGAWLLWPRTMRRDLASARPVEGAVRGLRITQQYPTAQGGPSDASPEVLDALFAQAAAYAQERGMNALFLDVTDAGLSSIAFRDRAFDTWPGAAREDSLLHRYDPLRALCEQASEAGLAVYAVTPQIDGNADWDAALARMQKKYAVAGIYVAGDALFDRGTQTPVFYADASSFGDAGALFLASLDAGFSGAVFDYAQCIAQPDAFSALASALDDSAARPALTGYVPGAALAVSYPADGAVLYTSSCFLMGTSDPAQPLLLNGVPVETRASGGTFGILADVAVGENIYTFTQNGASVSIHVTRPEPSSSGATRTTDEMPHDDTVEVAPGTPVRVNGWITSLLYDPSSDGNINETVRRGAVATVSACAETVRGGEQTWAYQLASGDYVLAYNVEVLDASTPRASFTGATAQPTATGEVLTFTGSGTPLAYTNMVDGNLEMDFYDADFAADFAVSGSSLVAGADVTPGAASTRVTLRFTQPVWGHTVEYADGTTQVILKRQPVRSGVFGKPLSGVTVLLDAGHGDYDSGAPGAAGSGAPAEKDVNLALTLAAKYRLEQMGASVQTIRTDDSFLSLEERNRAIITGQPDFFISVHHNSIDLSVDANQHAGTECYYFYPAGKTLAQTLVRNVTQATGRADRGAHWGYYYVTRSTVCPAVLLETGFMVNPVEYESVVSDAGIWAAGDAIARSVLECVPAS